MFALRLAFVALAATALEPCNGLDNGNEAGTTSAPADAAGAPVVDDVTMPDTATIADTTGFAHVNGSISFHSDASTVTAINVLAHGTGGSVYRGNVNGLSPAPLTFDLSGVGSHVLDFNVQDAQGRTSGIVTRTIIVQNQN